jgi:hypothetical protein
LEGGNIGTGFVVSAAGGSDEVASASRIAEGAEVVGSDGATVSTIVGVETVGSEGAGAGSEGVGTGSEVVGPGSEVDGRGSEVDVDGSAGSAAEFTELEGDEDSTCTDSTFSLPSTGTVS